VRNKAASAELTLEIGELTAHLEPTLLRKRGRLSRRLHAASKPTGCVNTGETEIVHVP